MIGDIISRVVAGEHLNGEEAYEAMLHLMRGEASDAQIASFLTALRMRGETAREIAGFARAMRESATTISPRVGPLVDTCGTGGDGLSTSPGSMSMRMPMASRTSALPQAEETPRFPCLAT